MPQAIVIDRPTLARVANYLGELFSELGGAWLEMFTLWRSLDSSPYLILLANTSKRMRLRAPLAYFVIDDKVLNDTLRMSCERLGAVKCQWALFIEKGSSAEQIVRCQLLIDSVVEGSA
jgi:hypothetical protein